MSNNQDQKARLNRNDQIYFLRDFDLLTSVSGQQLMLYDQANLELGESMMKSTYVLKEDNSKYTMGCHISQFRRFGPGIYLLFKLLKYLTIAFGIASIFAVAALIVLFVGQDARQIAISNEFKLGILKTTIYNLTKADFSSYVGLNFTITVILSILLIYWCEKQKTYTIECLKATPLASYSTVILKNLPEKYSEHDLQIYLSVHFGEIAQIYTVRNFGDDILYYKEMSEIVRQYKQEKVLTDLEPDRSCHRLANLFFQFRNGHIKLKQKIKSSQNYKPCFAFVQFKRVEDRQKLLQLQNKLHFLSCLKSKNLQSIQNPQSKNSQQGEDKPLYGFQKVSISQCQMQPCGIVWQNLHLTKSSQIMKTGVMLLLMVVILTVSIFLVILLSVVQMSVMNCKYKDMDREEILKLKDNYALLSYCINLSISQFYQQSDICSNYNTEYFKLTFMIFMIPLSISLFKLALTQIMKALVNFRRYAYEIKKIQSQSTILFVFYFLVTGFLQLVIYLGSQQTSFFDIFTSLIQSIVSQDFRPSKITLFSDYFPDWYITASYNIIMIGAISFNLSAIGIIFYCIVRKKICYHMANKQKLQIQMNNWLKGYSLQIEYVYAAVLTIIYFTLLFGGSMPLLYVLAFFSCLILFWSYKYIFINFCARPLTYNHSINRRVRKMILGAIIMHCFFTPIFYRAPKIADFDSQTSLFQRIFALWYYFVLMCLIALYLIAQRPVKMLFPILKEYFKKVQTKVKKDKKEKNEKRPSLEEDLPLPQHVVRKNYMLPTIVRKKHNEQNLESYSMHENQMYKQILKALYTINNKQRARKSCELNKDLFLLYQDTIKTNQNERTDYRTLVQVIKLVRRDFKKYQSQHGKGKNPYQKSKKKLYEIYEHSKKGQNHKYTLCFKRSSGLKKLMGSNGFSSSGSSEFQEEKDTDKYYMDDEGMSNGTKTKQIFLGSNLQQVIEQASCFEDQEDNQKKKTIKWLTVPEDKMKQSKNAMKRQKKSNLLRVQIPQSSLNRLNNSKM